jgi:nucleotide-binding universal stress UspA family protein
VYKGILIPTDGSSLSERAIKAGVDFAKSIGAKVIGLCATEVGPWSAGAYFPFDVVTPAQRQEMDAKWAKANLAVIENYAHSAKVPVECVHVVAEAPYRAILKTAEQKGCNLIFMASHGRRGLEQLVLGSETTKVLTHSKIPVLVYR